MDVELRNRHRNRRAFSQGLGAGTLSLYGFSTLARGHLEAMAAAKPTRFVYAWTAFDLLDPHVKYDGNAYSFKAHGRMA